MHLLLSHSRALLVSSALFHPFTALIIRGVTIHRCIAILGPAIRVSYRDPSIAILKQKQFFFFFKYQSHMAFSSVLPFLLLTHSVDCAVHLLLCHSKAFLVNSALFLPFTPLIMPFFLSSPH